MIWNTIAHPRMMTSGDGDMAPADGPTLPDENESVVEGIKYADPHKLAFFDLLIDASELNNPKLIHGDFETVKNKILNHELVVGGEIGYSSSPDGSSLEVGILIGTSITYAKNVNKILFDVPSSHGSFVYIVSSDNTVRSNSGAPFNPGDH